MRRSAGPVARVIALIAQSCLLIQLANCTSTRSVPVGPDLTRQEPKVSEPPGLSITGYVTADGVLHPLVGAVTIEADTLVFHPITETGEATYPARPAATYGPPFRLARAQVTSLNRVVPNNVHILLITTATVVVVVGVGLLILEFE